MLVRRTSDFPKMNQHSTIAFSLLAAAVAMPTGACQSALHPTLLPERLAPTCYQLEFGRWSAADSAPFSRAAVALVAPLPDTIALTRRVVTHYGRAYYELLTIPQDSSRLPGTWTEARRDTLVADIPSDTDVGLKMRLVGSDVRREGLAWVYFQVFVEGGVLYDPVGPPTPWATLTAIEVACPDALSTSSPGA